MKTLRDKEKMLVTSIFFFPTMPSKELKSNPINMSTNAFNVINSENLSIANELTLYHTIPTFKYPEKEKNVEKGETIFRASVNVKDLKNMN